MTATMVRRNGDLAVHDRRADGDPAAEYRNGQASAAGVALEAAYGPVGLPEHLPGNTPLEMADALWRLDLLPESLEVL